MTVWKGLFFFLCLWTNFRLIIWFVHSLRCLSGLMLWSVWADYLSRTWITISVSAPGQSLQCPGADQDSPRQGLGRRPLRGWGCADMITITSAGLITPRWSHICILTRLNNIATTDLYLKPPAIYVFPVKFLVQHRIVKDDHLTHSACVRCPRGLMCPKGYLNRFA